MKKLVYLVVWIGLITLFVSCKDKGPGLDNALMSYNPHVEAFTTGKISRYAPVYVVFNQDIDSARLKSGNLKKHFRISPHVEGKLSFVNDRTLAFQPLKAFDRHTDYKVTVDLSQWFPVSDSTRYVGFGFSTLPAAIRLHPETIDLRPTGETGYDISCQFFTADREDPGTVESLIAVPEHIDKLWQHSPDGKKHALTLRHMQAATRDSLPIKIAPNKLDIPQETLYTLSIPATDDFSLYRIQYVTEPERYIEATFTQMLDLSQNLQGLAYIQGNQSTVVQVEGNKIRLYPDVQHKEQMVVHLNQEIRSNKGKTLARDVVQSVEVRDLLPAVRFTGNGVIVPQSNELKVPFQTVYLRGVVVRVIKVLEQNIGQFLQSNDLDGASNLMQVGRLVARKTVFLDEDHRIDLGKWNTFALELNKLIQPEPGAIYRIELSFDRQLSVYPCDSGFVPMTKEQIQAGDLIKFREESTRFDEGGYYYYNGDMSWDDYNYQQRNDPCRDSYYFNKVESKNILATNLGLIAMAGEDQTMTVLVHSLVSTSPEQGVNLTLYNYQHQAIGQGTTDDKGKAVIRMSSGKPFYLIATLGAQRSYLRVDDGMALSLSTFDISGEVVQKGIKGFIYGDRGIWRPGDTLHIGFMLNDKAHQLPSGHPVVLEMYNPLGQLYFKKNQSDGKLGLYTFDLPTGMDVPTGVWNIRISVGGAIFEKRVRIESIKPNRLKIDLSIPEKIVLSGQPLDARLHVEWLQGAVARNLNYDIQGTFVSTPTVFARYKDYCFDDPAKKFNSEESKLISGKTNEQGNALITSIFDIGNSAPGMLAGNLVTRVFEESGDFSIDGTRIRYSPYRRYVGIRSPQQGKKQLNTGQTYTYQVASVDYQGQAVPNVPLEVRVYKVNWYWWWSSDGSNLANFVSDSYNKPVFTNRLTTSESGKASFTLNMKDEEWGTYYITVKDGESKHTTGIMSYFDWTGNEERMDAKGRQAATMLNIKTDKEQYTPGDKMSVTFPSSEGGRAIISIENGSRILSVSERMCTAGSTTVKLDVTPDMQPNAYVYVSLLQPYRQTVNDLPIRLYGVVPFAVTSPDSYLHPVVQVPQEIKPDTEYAVTVSEEQGKTMAYTVAIVDEGLLDLTHFKTPDPWKAFNAREALGVRTWDMYNLVLGAYGGHIEQLFSIGGDDALNKGPKAIVNRFKPVVEFDGPYVLKKGEKKRHVYKMPNYNGRVRVMIVAGNGEAYGDTQKSVLVRKPVMLLGTLPRVIGVNDEMVIPATVFATEPGVGDVNVAIAVSPNMQVVGSAVQSLHFEEASDKLAFFRVKVKDKPGVAKVTLTAEGKGQRSTYTTELQIRSVRTPQIKVVPVTLEAGKSWKETLQLPGLEGTNSLALEVADVVPLNLGERLPYLIDYPHGCLEQIVSKAFVQLYLPAFVALSREQVQKSEKIVNDVISSLRSYQTAEGAFAYWPGQTSTNAWATIYAGQFFCEAEAKGYLIPEAMKRSWLNNLKKVASRWTPVVRTPMAASEELTQAYRLYVLALAHSPEIGAMNRLKERPQLSSMARWMLAAAYAQIGQKEIAGSLVVQTSELASSPSDGADETFASTVRDKAIVLQTLCLLDKSKEAAEIAREISEAFVSDEWMSTQTTACGLMAMARYMTQYPVARTMDFTYTCSGKAQQVETDKSNWMTLPVRPTGKTVPVELTNTGQSTLFARFVLEGIPAEGEEKAYANGITLQVSYTYPDGRPVDVRKLQQGVNFTAVATIRNASAVNYRYLVLSQLFPAGWEILNTRFWDRRATPNEPAGVSYQDIRDDRVYSYINYLPAGRQVTVKINLCTVYPGKFYLPAVSCEAMYDRVIRANTAGMTVDVES